MKSIAYSSAAEFVGSPIVAFAPRVLSGLAIAVSLTALICLAHSLSPVVVTNCLNVSFYAAITAGCAFALSLIRDGINATLVTLDCQYWQSGFERFYKEAAITVISPVAAALFVGWIFIIPPY